MPTDLKTDAGLLGRLQAAARRGVSVEERREQRLSFVYGNLPKGSPLTRHEVADALKNLDALEGRS
jgi:hypothetical protein